MIDILLATFNSEKFLREQLDSIISQSFRDWRLLIRDGGSSDRTADIIREYCQKDDRIIFAAQGRAGAMENFSELLKLSDRELVMFADHDDVWFPEKIAMSLEKFSGTANTLPENTPLCIFTDALITDAGLKVTGNSNIRNQHLDPYKGLALPKLLVQNVPSGNTMFFNRALRELITPIPAGAVIHDHYTALAAVISGKLAFLDAPTLFYRQHNANVLGSSSYGIKTLLKKLFGGIPAIRKRFFANCRQAEALLQSGIPVDETSARLLKIFASLEKMNFFQRKAALIRYGFLKTGFLRNLGMFILI